MDGLLSFHNYSYKGRMVQTKPRSNLTEKTTNSIETSRQEEAKKTSLLHVLLLSFKASFKYNLHDIFFSPQLQLTLILLLHLYDLLLMWFY